MSWMKRRVKSVATLCRCRKITGDFDASETLQNIIANNEASENVRNAEAHVASNALSIILAIKAWLMVIW